MDTQKNTSTITVPVGFGGKTNPYVPDPAPTLLIELPSLETEREEERISALVADAESTAAKLVETAHADADAITAAAEQTAADTVRQATDSANEMTAAVEVRQAELEARSHELNSRSEELEAWSADLEGRQSAITARETAIDAEAAEATAILASAREDAEKIIAEAREHAEEVLVEARATAATEIARLESEAREASSADDAGLAERIEEIESVHRIEVQVLHDREAELLEQVALLESRLTALATPAKEPEPPAPEPEDQMEIHLQPAAASVGREAEARSNGRHTLDNGKSERGGSTAITSHAPLTEQLSTSVFRTAPDQDRKGRRRR